MLLHVSYALLVIRWAVLTGLHDPYLNPLQLTSHLSTLSSSDMQCLSMTVCEVNTTFVRIRAPKEGPSEFIIGLLDTFVSYRPARAAA